jgi:hypothetical protein
MLLARRVKGPNQLREAVALKGIMTHSRQHAPTLGMTATGILTPPMLTTPTDACSVDPVSWRPGVNGQRRADLGDGRYRSPISSGDRPDPNILNDGVDYWVAFSAFEHFQGDLADRAGEFMPESGGRQYLHEIDQAVAVQRRAELVA